MNHSPLPSKNVSRPQSGNTTPSPAVTPKTSGPYRVPKDKRFYRQVVDFEGTIPLSISKVLSTTQSQNYAALINSSQGNKMVAKVELFIPEGPRKDNQLAIKVQVYAKEDVDIQPQFETVKVDKTTQVYSPKKRPVPLKGSDVDAVNMGSAGQASQEMTEFSCPMCSQTFAEYVAMYKHLQNVHLQIKSTAVEKAVNPKSINQDEPPHKIVKLTPTPTQGTRAHKSQPATMRTKEPSKAVHTLPQQVIVQQPTGYPVTYSTAGGAAYVKQEQIIAHSGGDSQQQIIIIPTTTTSHSGVSETQTVFIPSVCANPSQTSGSV